MPNLFAQLPADEQVHLPTVIRDTMLRSVDQGYNVSLTAHRDGMCEITRRAEPPSLGPSVAGVYTHHSETHGDAAEAAQLFGLMVKGRMENLDNQVRLVIEEDEQGDVMSIKIVPKEGVRLKRHFQRF